MAGYDYTPLALMRFSRIIANRHTLRKLDPSEIAQVTEAISQRLEDISKDTDLEAWETHLLSEGLIRLCQVLKYCMFFGHSRVFDELLLLQSKAERVESRRGGEAKTGSILKVLETIALAVALYAAPDVTSTATQHYLEILKPPRLTFSGEGTAPKSIAHLPATGTGHR